jgi:hypothetical protein
MLPKEMSVTVPLVSFDPSDVNHHPNQMAEEQAPKNEAHLANFSQVPILKSLRNKATLSLINFYL